MVNRTSLTVMQLNDSHAYFDLHQEMFQQGSRTVYRPAGGYARIATIVKQIQAANQGHTLFCDCGDTLHGTYPVQKTQGTALLPILNSLGLDAMTAHWEFAFGPETFKQRAAELSYPMLAINVYDQATRERFFPPYSVKETGGVRIGIVCVASNIIDKTMPPSFSIIPMNPPVSTVEITEQELLMMLEENIERTFACDPHDQMGGYVKRCLGLNAYFKIENPAGHRIQKLFVGNEEVNPEQYYTAAFVTLQGVPQKYGRNRENRSERSIDAMQATLIEHRLLRAELRGTFTAV